MAVEIRGAPGGPAPWDETNPALRTPHDTDLNRLAYEIYVRQADTDHGGHNLTNVGAITQETWRSVGAVGQPAFQNGWVNYGDGFFEDARFFKGKDGVVRLHGLVKNGTTSTVVFTLPADCRPSGWLMFVAIDSGGVCRIYVKPDGTVSQVGGLGNGFLTLSGISFRAA